VGALARQYRILDTTATYTSAERTLRPGDALLVYSDGISEARDAAGNELGIDRVAGILRDGRDLDAPALVREVERTVDAHSSDAPVEDDRTVLVLKRTGAASV